MQAHATQPSSNLVFDPAQIRRARMRSHSKLSEHGFLIDWVSDQIIDRLSLVKRDFETALHIGNRATNDFNDELKRATNAKPSSTKLKGIKNLKAQRLDKPVGLLDRSSTRQLS